MTPEEITQSIRRHVEHASGGLHELPEDKRAAFWRILEFQAGQILAAAIQETIEAEREACAQLVENHWPTGRASDMNTIAAEIRARKEQP